MRVEWLTAYGDPVESTLLGLYRDVESRDQARPAENSPSDTRTPPRRPWWRRRAIVIPTVLLAIVVAAFTVAQVAVAYTLQQQRNWVALQTASHAGSQVTLPFTGLNHPESVAVDATGNLYVVDGGNNRVVKLAAGSNTQTVLPFTGLTNPSDLAVDAAGNVYMIASRVVMKLAPGSDNWTQLQGAPPLVDPMGLAADTRGNVYVTDHVGSRATGGGLPWEKDEAQGFVLKLPAG